MRRIILAIILLAFPLLCFGQEKYPVTKENYDQLNEIFLETGRYVRRLNKIAKESKIIEQKEKLYLLLISTDAIFSELSSAISLLDIERAHAKENQISNLAISTSKALFTGFIDNLKSTIQKYNDALSTCKDDLLTNEYKNANELYLKIVKVLENIRISL